MSIFSTLNAGVAGLAANANQLATISDNIANSSTSGYKRAVTDFHAMVLGGQSRYTAGGVRTTTQRLIDERGPLTTTTNSTDVAIRGRGFLPVTDSAAVAAGATDLPFGMATTGSFRMDASGYLTSPAGQVLLGWAADADGTIPDRPRDTKAGLEPVRILTNQFAAEPTTEVDMKVNLPATGTEAGASGDPEELSIEYFDTLGKSQSLTVSFTPTVPAAGASNEWTMVITDDGAGGAVVGEYTLTFDTAPGQGGTLQNVATTTGGAYDAATGTINVPLSGVGVEIDIGTLGASGGITQLSDTFMPVSISKNGSPPGTLTSVEIDENGFVSAFFDTGLTRRLYQVPIVDVPNPNGLSTLDSATFEVSPDSGPFYLWDAGTGPTGSMVSYAREESTVDVAAELTSLIQTQRAYSSNAKVIMTVDEMLQETTNLKR